MSTTPAIDDVPSFALPLADTPVCRRSTWFAPAGRASEAELAGHWLTIQSASLLQDALDVMPNMVMILNAHRQIVAANAALLHQIGMRVSDVLGKRPGEALGCQWKDTGPDGCGTARQCMTCGAVQAILAGLNGQQHATRECRILAPNASGIACLELRITTSPIQVQDQAFLVVVVEDIRHAKRVAVLQTTFFHDVLNLAGCIQGYADYLGDAAPAEQELCRRLSVLAGDLTEAIAAHRDLLYAESGDLALTLSPCRPGRLLADVAAQYLRHPQAAQRHIVTRVGWDGLLVTDRRVMHRVLGNMLKNALEATAEGNTVTLTVDAHEGNVVFSVHNVEVIPDTVQMQIFQRSFSTKAANGRGIGTYSMKLLGERYLHGKVSFTSRAPEGTTFTLALPQAPPAAG